MEDEQREIEKDKLIKMFLESLEYEDLDKILEELRNLKGS